MVISDNIEQTAQAELPLNEQQKDQRETQSNQQQEIQIPPEEPVSLTEAIVTTDSDTDANMASTTNTGSDNSEIN